MDKGTDKLGSIAVIGPGKVGGAIHAAALGRGFEAALLGRGDLERDANEAIDADVAILAVADREIADACARLCRSSGPPRLVGHTSGATPLAGLARAAEAGAATFSMHPLQTFAGPGQSLLGIPCAITADRDDAASDIWRLAEGLGMRPFHLDEESRIGYHAAASIASNFLVALEETAVAALDRAGVADGRSLLAPLVTLTARNWAERGGDALTGPIARGDEQTVASHLEWIAQCFPEIDGLYRELAERARAVAGSEASP